MPIDPRLRARFFAGFWSSEGWGGTPFSAGDEAELREAGLLIPSRLVDHDEAVAHARESTRRSDPRRIARAFVASLGSRRLDLRSAFGSYAVGRRLPDHPYEGEHGCRVCGAWHAPSLPEEFSVLEFERHKWGGVRHADPVYIGFDLDRFATETMDEPTEGDRSILAAWLDGLRSLPAEARPQDAAALLRPLLRSNDAERRTLVDILGYVGILAPRGRSGFFREFTPFLARDPPGGKNDWAYPVSWWRGTDGVDEEAVAFWFGNVTG